MPPKTFKANVRQEMLVSKDDVKKAIAEKPTIVDNRPQDFHVGLSKSPSLKVPAKRSASELFVSLNGDVVRRVLDA